MAINKNYWAWEKKRAGDLVEWAYTSEVFDGLFLFRIGARGRVYNLFGDYPEKLTAEELEIFNKEYPYWAEFFQERLAALKN